MRLASEQRRALRAADELIDTTLDELTSSGGPGWSANGWLIGGLLPSRYAIRYDGAFARKFFISLVTIVWKLGQPGWIKPSGVAEELAAHILIEEAQEYLEDNDEEADFGVFEDSFFKDLDFEYLYDDAYDGIETADVADVMGITNLTFGEWFEPFAGTKESEYTEVHPYTWPHDVSDDNSDIYVDELP